MDLLNQAVTTTSSRQDYSLTEIVGILTLIKEGVKIADISLLTNRSIHSLRYKFFEKKPLKGKERPRSVHQYATIRDLYSAYGETFTEEDLASRVASFQQSIKR